MSHRLQHAARLYSVHEDTAAEGICRAILNDDPDHFDTLHLLGVLLTNQNRSEEALPFLRRAHAAQPDHAKLRVNLGNVLLATKQFDQVIAMPTGGDAAALNNLGLAHRALEQYEEATQAFQQATNVRWDYSPGWFNLATTLAKLDQLEQALAVAHTALRVAPLDTPVSRLQQTACRLGHPFPYRRRKCQLPGSYSTDRRERVLRAVEAGASRAAVAERFMVGRSSVYRWVAVARDEGRRALKPMQGGPKPIIRDEIEAALRRLLEENNHLTLTECRDRLAAETGVRVNPGPSGERCGGWTGGERSAAFSLLSRTVMTSRKRAPMGRQRPPGLAALRRNGWCFLMKVPCSPP